MPMPKLKIDYTFTGPLFNGDAARMLPDFIKEVEKQISEYGVTMIRNRYANVFRYRSPSKHKGKASAAVRSRLVNNHRQLEAGPIVYGAWLEGTGSRNASTRFKGYRTFRLVTQELNHRAVKMAEVVLQPYLRKMNGR